MDQSGGVGRRGPGTVRVPPGSSELPAGSRHLGVCHQKEGAAQSPGNGSCPGKPGTKTIFEINES